MEKTKILIVDDEKRILDSFSMLLEDFCCAMKTATEPEQAINLVSKQDFDIVFLDQFLGGTTGLELMKRMHAIKPDIYFVIISGNGSSELVLSSLKQGATDFISKPFFVSDLIKSIDYVKKKQQLDRERHELILDLSCKLDKKTKELRAVYFPVLSSLVQVMEKKDVGTYGHSIRVRQHSSLIAAALDLSAEEREILKVSAMLHDIGKIGTSDMILGKPGPLSEDEMKIVRSHPQKGFEILKPLKKIFDQMESILPAILHHHENYDGSGYPLGLSGDDIPLPARIIAVADTYDAILSDRPYRTAADHEHAVEELTKHAGTQFDGKIVHSFIRACNQYDRLFEKRRKDDFPHSNTWPPRGPAARDYGKPQDV